MKHLTYDNIKYILHADGTITLKNINDVFTVVKRGIPLERVFVEEITDDVRKINKTLPKNKQLSQKLNVESKKQEWTFPLYYQNLNIEAYIEKQFIERMIEENRSNDDVLVRLTRLQQECTLYKKLDLLCMLRLIVYIVDTFNKQDVIWGIGRGSSVSSYVLYILELHDVDSVEYDLNIHDFLRKA